MLQKRTGWRRIPEGTLRHGFAGDAATANDRLAVVVRRAGHGAELYARGERGWRQRALVTPDARASLSRVSVVDNAPGGVTLAAAFTVPQGQTCVVHYRLTAGSPVVKVLPAERAARLLVHANTQCVVVPEFFAEDLVYAATAAAPARVGLPTENQVLQLVEGGDSIVMSVWASPDQRADLLRSPQAGGRATGGVEIACRKGQSLWVACLEGRGIWNGGVAPEAFAPPWRPPFPARWRLCAMAGKGPWSSIAVDDESHWPAWMLVWRVAAVAYPLDRNRATPLTVLCPIDILRDTLGVGPCQYVLAAEGLEPADAATAGQATAWIEQQFERKRDHRKADEIRERLDLVVAHLKRLEVRIEQYRQLAVRLRELCPRTSPFRGRLSVLLDPLARALPGDHDPWTADRVAKVWAPSIIAHIGKRGAVGSVKSDCANIRRVGGDHDRGLARCRMAVRRLEASLRTEPTDYPPTAAIVEKVRAEIAAWRKKGASD
jgi:hypothetical protein